MINKYCTMANAKNRFKTTKKLSTTNSKNAKSKITPSSIDIASEPIILNSRQTKMLASQDKIQCILQKNSQIFRKKSTDQILTNNVKRNKQSMAITKSSLLTKSGRIKKKTKSTLKLVDNILKRELMIDEADSTKKNIKKRLGKVKQVNIVNNNVDSISNQNNISSLLGTTMVSNNRDLEINLIQKNKIRNITSKYKLASSQEIESKTKHIALSNGVLVTLFLFQCDYCQKTFNSKPSLRRHIYTHLNWKPYACAHCPKKFRRDSYLQIHVKKTHPNASEINKPEVYLCNVCDKPFLLKENLSLHLASHIKKEDSFKCVYCNRKFPHHLLLLQHEKQHLVTGKYNCSICNMSYDSRSRLAFHVKSHLKIKDFICQYCGKEFLRPNSVNRHVQVCHGGHRVQCPICNKKLKGHLTEHLRTHEKQRPHECPECGQRFTQSTQLNVHRRSHTGARPYPCQICGRPFSHSSALMLHIRRHTGEKPFPCAMCPMAFSQLPHMKAHMRNIHGKNDPYKCEKCNQFFKLKVQLQAHVKMCTFGDQELTFEEKIQASVQYEDSEIESVMSLSRMRFLLALLLTMIASKEKLKYLGFNKRLIDDLLVESLEAMDLKPCKDGSISPLKRLKTNIHMLLIGTIPKEQMDKFQRENKTTEELLELLTNVKKNE